MHTRKFTRSAAIGLAAAFLLVAGDGQAAKNTSLNKGQQAIQKAPTTRGVAPPGGDRGLPPHIGPCPKFQCPIGFPHGKPAAKK